MSGMGIMPECCGLNGGLPKRYVHLEVMNVTVFGKDSLKM